MSTDVIRSAWRARGAAGAGLVFVALNIVAGAVLPKPPKTTANAATLSRYLTVHHQRIETAAALSALAALVLLVFIVGLGDRLADRFGARLTLAGGVLLVSVAVVGAMVQSTVAQASDRMSGDAVVAAFAVVDALFFVAPAFGTVALLAGVVRGGAGVLPVWLRAFAALLAVLAAVAAVCQLVSTSDAGSVLGFAGFISFVVWIACASVVLLRAGASEIPSASASRRVDPAVAR